MQVNGFLDQVPGEGKFWYIYRLTCKHSGHFYIGQTAKLKDRMYGHFRSILSVIDGSPDPGASKFHFTVAPIASAVITQERRKIPRVYKDFSVYVIAIVGDKDTACLVESHHIALNRSNELCLNDRA